MFWTGKAGGLAASCRQERKAAKGRARPAGSRGEGCSLGRGVRCDDRAAGQTILDPRAARGKGICSETTGKGTLRLSMSDATTRVQAECDLDVLTPGVWHHVVITVDGGPKIVTFVVDGVLCDGGDARQYGWSRFPASLGDVNGNRDISLGLNLHGRLGGLRIYNRYLRTSEAVGNFRAGR